MQTRRQFLTMAASSFGFLQTLASSAQARGAPSDILGLDTYTYPGDRAMDVLWSKHGFRITGLYLTHSPSKLDRTWPSKRAHLKSKGWGIFPIYLGSQNLVPPRGAGKIHGEHAAGLMFRAGFPKLSVVYLDVETPKPAGGAFEQYIKDWNFAVKRAGYTPGIYCSYLMAPWATKLSQAVWTVELPFAKGRISPDLPIEQRAVIPFAYDPTKHPHGIIRAGCIATQFLWYRHAPDLHLPPGVKNVFDFNSSKVADPSNPNQIAELLGVPRLSA